MSATTRAVVYARQSVAEDEGMARQEERSRALIEQRGWSCTEVYADNNTSASKSRGPSTGWGRMLAAIDAAHVDVVVAVNLDRLLRGIGDLDALLRRGVKVVTVEGDLDLSTETGELHATVLAAVARFEVRRKAARSARAAVDRRRDGHPSAGLVPFGYRWIEESRRDASGTRYRLDIEEAAVVRFMFDEALAGSPLGSICRELNERGSRTRRGIVWRSTTVRRMLLSPFYAGLLPASQARHYSPEAVDLDQCQPGSWKAIVSEDEVRAVRAKLLNPARRTNGGTTARKWLLSGLAECDVCGGSVRSAVTKERYRAYRCVAGHFQRRAEIIDHYVEEVVLDRLSQPDAASLVSPRAEVNLPELRAKDAALASQSAQLLRWYREARFDPADIERQQAEISAERSEIAAQLVAALAADPVADVLAAGDDVRSRWASLTLARRRAVVASLLTLRIRSVGKGVRVHSLEEAEPTIAVIWRREVPRRTPVPTLVTEAGLGVYLDVPEASRRVISEQLS